ncbi:hypothetical protein LV89_04840 [Arcicella aurantiaca]|uniref:PLOD1-3-like GT domain-containing protein n=1 Tax=Arcicella aurantiaca TaxID=591202 RepID=A0A316DF60_9BACT|nr:glycosyltransferase domain-containing protein [Arcicella aurantiaca]PWK16674.1 hypothetical protein LV89_04840 [Arcicella aurantiaca]
MKIITCISDEEDIGYKYALKASCTYHNLDLITLLHTSEWSTHRNKDLYLKSYLLTLPKNEIILFTDGYDTIFIGGEKQILKRYELVSPESGIVISTEKYCSPDSSLTNLYPLVRTQYRFLNSGGIIGKVSDILELLEKVSVLNSENENIVSNQYKWSNQYLWTQVFLKEKDLNIKLDINCELFQTIPNSIESGYKYAIVSNIKEREKMIINSIDTILSEFMMNDGITIKNISTNTYPIHLHFCGDLMKSAMFMEPFNQFIGFVNNEVLA